MKFLLFIFNMFKKQLTNAGTDALVQVFDKLYAKDPAIHKTVLTSIYGPVDVHLETLVEETKTELDDVAVESLKKAIELSAAKYSIPLQNLDTD